MHIFKVNLAKVRRLRTLDETRGRLSRQALYFSICLPSPALPHHTRLSDSMHLAVTRPSHSMHVKMACLPPRPARLCRIECAPEQLQQLREVSDWVDGRARPLGQRGGRGRV